MQSNHFPFLRLFNGDMQYVVPRWQRRYCWDGSDIRRLVQDLLVIGESDRPDAAHYGGALLTFPEPVPPGGVPTHRVVDGQQRLTTVSILVACISEVIGSDQEDGWTKDLLRHLLTNPPFYSPEKRRKLRLQDGDEEEYRRGLEGNPGGPGAVAQAWRITRRLVNQCDVNSLLRGLGRFKVVSISLGPMDDPQQIFESLNATGRPLTESEKVKNWLLMGLADAEQQYLYKRYWLAIEKSLGVMRNTETIDKFLRDLLRWKTGRYVGRTRIYEDFRRWALREKLDQERPVLCQDLARLARLYGILTYTAGGHTDVKVEKALRHFRGMGIVAHRPLMLRILDDAAHDAHLGVKDALVPTLEVLSSWITRLWLANRNTAGLNTAIERLAHRSVVPAETSYSNYWLERIRELRDTRVGVPSDEEVRDGILTRNAYSGSARRSAWGVLCTLMEHEHVEFPARSSLTIEHVMPRKLTSAWKRDLGKDAEELHKRWLNRFANLTLCGDTINSAIGAAPFHQKCEVYAESSIGMTRRLAKEEAWNEEALARRAHDLAEWALKRWPWKDPKASLKSKKSEEDGPLVDFWRFLKQETGGVFGQKDPWNWPTLWTGPVNQDDWVRVYVGDKLLRLDIAIETSAEGRARMQEFSQRIRDELNDQAVENPMPESKAYVYSVCLVWYWTLRDESQWSEAAWWLKDQHDRLWEVVQY